MDAFRAGAAVVDITPTRPLFLLGYPDMPRIAEGVSDPLLVSALWLEGGGAAAVILSVDLAFLSTEAMRALRIAIGEACRLSADAVCIACTHTHSAPVTIDYLAFRDDPVVTPTDPAYLRQVEEAVVRAATAARAASQPASVAWTSADATGIGGNRHAIDGPADPEVPVLAVRGAADGRIIAVALTHAMHPTVLHEDSRLVSGDYPGFARLRLQRDLPGAVIVHLTGTSGDQSPRRHVRANTLAEARRLGEDLGARVAGAVASIAAWDDAPQLGARCLEMGIERRRLPDLAMANARLDRLRAEFERLRACGAPAAELRSAECAVFGGRELVTLARLQAEGVLDRELIPYRTVPIQALRVGCGRFACLPGEWFVAYGLALKRGVRGPLAVVSLANGELQGYIVSRDAEGGSSYEAGMALFPAADGEALCARLATMLSELGP
jgi:neutral ceramidase